MILTKDNYFTRENTYISNSKIGDYLKSPEYYKGKHITGNIEREVTDAMIIGSAVDTWLTDSHQSFLNKFEVVIRRDKKSNNYEYQLNESMLGKVNIICTKAEKQPAYKELAKHQKQVMLYNDEFNICGILDFLSISKDGKTATITDLKTANNATPRMYHYKCLDMGYYRQMAMYDLLVRLNYPKVENVIHRHLVVEKDPDNIHNCYTFIFNEDRVNYEKRTILETVKKIRHDKKFIGHKASWKNAIYLGDYNE